MGLVHSDKAHWAPETEGIELLDVTMGDLLRATTKRLPDKEAVVYSVYPEFGIDIRWTYSTVDRKVDEVARGLLALGIRKGNKVAVWSSNIPEWILLMFAITRIGAIIVTVNIFATPRDIEYVLKQSDAKALFLMPKYRMVDYIQNFETVVPNMETQKPGALRIEKLPELRIAAIMNSGGATRSGYLLFEDIVEMGGRTAGADLDRAAAAVNPTDPAMIQYTSGTTGSPKGAMLTHRNLVNIRTWYLVIGQSEKTIHFDPMPFFHVGGCVMGIVAPFSVGGTVVVLIEFDPKKALEAIHKERCNIGGGVPTMLLLYLSQPDFKSYDLTCHELMIAGAANVPVELAERVKKEFGAAKIRVVYGLTEATGTVSQVRVDDPPEYHMTIGRPIPHVEVKLVDPAGGKETVGIGQIGEICVRGFNVMSGYYNMPEQTRETIDEAGWLHTGDLAVMNAAGYMNITGRSKDMIIRGGENIYPKEIEELLMTNSKIEQAYVIGVPDLKWGEQVCAVIKPRAGMTTTQEEVVEFLAPMLARHKLPKYVQFAEQFPLTANGKIQKFKLREQMIQALGLQEEAAAAEKHA
jgi:fatty-acyl-CoA synthase